jgi:c-di-GMP-binding flagellar brake protein YcgR
MPKASAPRASRGKERRRFLRKPLQMELEYQSLKKSTISPVQNSQTHDVSAGGLAMVSNRPLEQDQLLLVTLYLPAAAPAKAESKAAIPHNTATILSRVAWCLPTPNKDYFRLGIQFLDLAKDDRKQLKSFLVNWKLDRKNSKLYT